ncbi:MAG: hypothetical protein NT154_15260 [Verrucomicrobia bacterium]|nr:hypothetical protein [Verrucomicrobiota bacterium]
MLKYGCYGAVAFICATLAALGSFKRFPLLMGAVHQAFLGGMAIAMILQGVAFSRTKKQDCFIVRREELIGGSFILFVGAGLLLVLLLSGCNPAAARPRLNAAPIKSFSVAVNRQLPRPLFGADGPGSFAAQDPAVEDAKHKTRPLAGGRDLCRLADLGSQLCVLKTALARARWADNPLH